MMRTRREVLVSIVGTTLILAFPGCGRQSGARVDLERMFGGDVAPLGEAWLNAHPTDAATLVADLFGDAIPEDATRVILASIRADYAAGRVADVAGWRLSLTECRVAALVTLP